VVFITKRWLQTARNLVSRAGGPVPPRPRRPGRLHLERLECRLTPSNNIGTVAGNGGAGYSGDGGPATSAMLYIPFGVAVDSSGNVFIADTYNNRIREVVKSTGTILTVAGTGAAGFGGDGGSAALALLSRPYGVAVDAVGNLFISDTYNNRIREVVKSTGNILTLAGTGTVGSGGDGGPATSAQLNSPFGLAVDSSGNLFIADQGNNRIREVVRSSGIITTVAGNGIAGYLGDGGPATLARLNQPSAVAVDPAGNLFIADWQNNRVREVARATGNIVTIAGTGTGSYSGDGGPATSAAVNHPNGVAVDSSGNVYIGDSSNNRIRQVVLATGTITTYAGTGSGGFGGDGGPANSALVNYPNAVAADSSGNLFIADTYNYRIREVLGNLVPTLGSLSSAAWTVNQPGYQGTITITGGTAPYSNLTATGLPPGLSVTLSGSTIALSGTPTATGTFGSVSLGVRDATGAPGNRTYTVTINAFPTLGALSPAQWVMNQNTYPGAIPISAGTGPFTVASQYYLPTGLTATVTGSNVTFTGTPTALGTYNGIQVTIRDAAGAVVTGAYTITITVPTPGSIITLAGTGASGYGGDGGPAYSALLSTPEGVTVDANGNIFIADYLESRVREIVKATGNITTIAGSGAVGYNGDGGPATAAALFGPTAVAVDASGNVFIADYGNHRIREVVRATGNITTVAGNGTGGYAGDGGPATAAKLYYPSGVALDASGNIYIADNYNHRIREVSQATGTITTIAGNGTGGYGGDGGPATSAKLYYPQGVAVDANGNVFIADYFNQRIREVAQATGIITTFAGTGSVGAGGDGGPATSAQLYCPSAIAFDASGNVFIADTSNNRIREVVKSTGNITTFAGNGVSGYGGDTGPATAAQLNGPEGVAVDSSGNVIIADAHNARVREVVATSTPTLGPLSATAWTVNLARYSGTITIAGGVSPYSNLTATGLPPGLTANPTGSTVTLNGTPTATGTFSNINVSIRDANGNPASRTFTLVINPAPTLGSFTGNPWTVGRPGYPGAIGLSGGTGSLFVSAQSNLPPGLTATVTGGPVSGSTVTFTGTPTTAGVFNSVQVTVRDAVGATVSGTYSITINPAPSLGALSSSAWTVNQPGFSGSISVAGGTAALGNLTATGLPAGLAASLTGTTVTVSGTPTAAGTFSNVSVSVRDAAGATASRTFSITIDAVPTLGSLSPAQWTVGQSGYTGAIPISGGTGPLVVSAQANLPPGLTATVTGSNVTFTGMPSTAGTFASVQLTVQDAAGVTVNGTYSITINPAPTLGALSSAAWTVNQPGFSGSTSVAGGTAPLGNLTATGLPAGLTASLTGSTVTLSGTPTAAGTFSNVSVSVRDAAGAVASGTFSLTINPAPTLGSLAPSQWTVGQSGYTGAIPISGGTGPLVVSAQSNLPPGLTATITGSSVTFTGTPTTAGTFANVQLTVQDAAGVTTNRTFAVTINALPVIVTAAGIGTAGFGGDGGPATSASLYNPSGVAVDANGNVFIADTWNHRVREVVKATGNIVTTAGTGSPGYSGDGGPATSAQLDYPSGVAVDGSGNVFIADTSNHSIREVVQATGNISTVAGNGNAGYSGDGGPASAAQLNHPTGVALDGSGDLFIADQGNNVIREVIQASGNIVTVAGTGTAGYSGDGGLATAALLNAPAGVTLDGSGNLFIADSGNNVIREVVQATGNISTVAGNGSAGYSGDGGPATAASLNGPTAVALDTTGNLFIADRLDNVIRTVSRATGNIRTLAGTGTAGFGGDDGAPTVALLNAPAGVAVDGSGNVFIADTSNQRIREVVANPSSPSLGSLSSTAWTVNQPGFTGTIAIVGGFAPYGNLTVTGLPPGLTATLSGSTITLSGTPTQAGIFNNINVVAQDAIGSIANAGFSITINPAPALGSLAVTQWTAGQSGFPGAIPISGGTGSLVLSAQANLPPGLTATLTGANITFTGTPTGAGTFANVQLTIQDTIGATATSTFSITINPAPTLGSLTPMQWTAGQGGYTGAIPITGGTAGLFLNGQSTLPPGLTAHVTGSNVTFSGTPTTAGTFANVQVTVQDAAGATASGTFSITINPAPTLGSLSATAWTVNQPGFSGSVSIAGGTGPFGNLTASGLPAGLSASLSGTTVTVSGTPTASGTFANVSVSVRDAAGVVASRTFILTINATPTLGTLSPSQWTVGQSGYTGAIPVNGGTAPLLVSSQANLPPGLTATITGSSVTFTGTPTTAGTFANVQITVQDATGATVSGTFTITINPPLPTITTIAGTGVFGSSGDGGPATSAWLGSPQGVVVDASGNVFFADLVGNKIREVVKATGIIITVAGNGTQGYSGDGGPATSAMLNYPTGVALDSNGNVFFDDTYNHRVREVVNTTGIIITVAGTGTRGFSGDGGPATSAMLNYPYGVAVDANGNVFIADTDNNRIREVVKATGNIVTVAGTGYGAYNGDGVPATTAQVNLPYGVAVDANGNLFIADSFNNRIREVNQATGVISTIAGNGTLGYSGDGGPATAAMLYGPRSVAVDASGNVFIADYYNHRIREVVQATGVITTVAGTGTRGYNGDGQPAISAQLNYPFGVALDASGDIFIGDTYNNRIREVLHL
jgi:sugar lactone lactonase YvrE